MSKFYPIGTRFVRTSDGNFYIFAQIGVGQGSLINTTNGNRWRDDAFLLAWDDVKLAHGAYDSPEFNDYLQGASRSGHFIEVQSQSIQEPAKPAASPKKPPKISFFRYVRQRDEFGGLAPRGGMALAFEIDYVKRIISVGVSICNDENFDRVIGRTIAGVRLLDKQSPYHFEFPFTGEIGNEGTVSEFYYYLHELLFLTPAGKDTQIVNKIIKNLHNSF